MRRRVGAFFLHLPVLLVPLPHPRQLSTLLADACSQLAHTHIVQQQSHNKNGAKGNAGREAQGKSGEHQKTKTKARAEHL